MKNVHIYWGFMVGLGMIHLHALLLIFPWDVPIYLTGLFVLGLTLFLYKRVLIRFSMGVKMNTILVCIQLLLLLVYLAVDPSWIYFVPFSLFVTVEWLRLHIGGRFFHLQQNIKQFEEQRDQFNETFRAVRSERHDFLKHVSALHFMLENNKQEDAKAYLDELVEGYEETNLSIKGERGTVAGILHQMYRQAKAVGIDVVYDLDLPLSTLPLSDKNIVGLLGNLLSNGIDACEEWQNQYQKQALLTLQFYKRSGLYLLICKNNSLPIPTEILDELFHSFGHTTKTGKHEGLGTKIIQDVVEEHHGFLDFVYKEEEFTVKIKVPAIR